MNKLMGFLELKEMSLPSIPWKQYTGNEKLDVDNLWGDPTKAKTVLGWNPQKTSYEELVEIMAKNDRELAKREKAMKAVM